MADAGDPPYSYAHDHEDVVVDTNVMSHGDNENSVFHADALDFLIWLIDETERHWVLDDNGRDAPLISTSLIWAEYSGTVARAGTAMLLFQQALDLGRVCFARRPGEQQSRLIRRLVPRNPKDRVVLGAAANSGSRWLVTNDSDDFDDVTCEACQEQLNVKITDAYRPTD
jgi:hypothetical protein